MEIKSVGSLSVVPLLAILALLPIIEGSHYEGEREVMMHLPFLQDTKFTDREYEGYVLHVGGTGPSNYTAIQDALDDSSDGDRIIVHPGHYWEQLIVSSEVMLIGSHRSNITNPGSIALYLEANNVTITGFNFTWCGAAVYSNGYSGHNISSNRFLGNDYDIAIDDTAYSRKTDIHFHGLRIWNNDFNGTVSYDSVNVRIHWEFDDTSDVDITIRDIEVFENSFYRETSLIFLLNLQIDLSQMGAGSTALIGDTKVQSNSFVEGINGIRNSFAIHDSTDLTMRFGDITISDNTIKDQSLGAISIYPWRIYDIAGVSDLDFGDIKITGNDISSHSINSAGIEFPMTKYFTSISDNTTVEMGEVEISNNRIGPCMENALFLSSMISGDIVDGSSSVNIGNISIMQNVITDSGSGIIFGSGNTGTMEDSSSYNRGEIRIISNRMDDVEIGIKITEKQIGYDMKDLSSTSIGDIVVRDNNIENSSIGINYEGDELGVFLDDASSFVKGEINITGNNIWSSDGIIFDQSTSLGNDIKGNSSAEFGGFNLSGNFIHSDNYGIYIDELISWGNRLYDNASTDFGQFRIDNNEIVSNSTSIWLKGMLNFGYNNHNGSSFCWDSLSISSNDIISNASGVIVSSIIGINSRLRGSSSAEIGDLEFTGNNINSKLGSLSISGMGYVGSNLYNRSSSIFGRMVLEDNQVISDEGSGISITGLRNWGSVNTDETTSRIGIVRIMNNDVVSNETPLELDMDGGMGQTNDDESQIYFDGVQVIGNTAVSNGSGIMIDIDELGEGSSGACILDVGSIHISNNYIRSNSSSSLSMEYIDLSTDAHLDIDGINVINNDIVSNMDSAFEIDLTGVLKGRSEMDVGSTRIENNNFTCIEGIGLDLRREIASGPNTDLIFRSTHIKENLLKGSSLGLNISDFRDTSIYLNEFIDNVQDTEVDNSSVEWTSPDTIWYKYERTNLSSKLGNFWDRYSGVDEDDNGIGDEPYNTAFVHDDKPLINRVSEYLPPWEDSIPPNVTIISPKMGDFLNDRDIHIVWESFDDLLGIDHFEVRSDDGPWINIGNATTYTVLSPGEGEHKFQVNALDMAGNENVTSVQYTIDRTDPTGHINSPADGSYISSKEVTITWSADDDLSGISHYQFSLDGSNWTDVGNITQRSIGNLSEGRHTAGLRIQDIAGNTLQLAAEFFIDTGEPEVRIMYPSRNLSIAYSSVYVEWTSFDDISGISDQWIRIDDGPYLNKGTLSSHLFTNLSFGEHSINVRVMDGAGNVKRETKDFVIVDDQNIILISSPEDGSYIDKDTVTIEWDLLGMTYPVEMIQTSFDGQPFVNISSLGSRSFYDLDEGEHLVVVKVIDRGGNFDTDSVSFVIDTLSPMVIGYSHVGDTAPPFDDIVISFSEMLDPGTIQVFFEDEVIAGVWNPIDLNYTISAEMEPGQTVNLEVYCEDLAGNSMFETHFFKTMSKGTIRGQVLDTEGDPVIGARIEMVQIEIDIREQTLTNETGHFEMDVKPGSRTVLVYDRYGNRIGEFDVVIEPGRISQQEPFIVDLSEDEESSYLWLVILIIVVLIIVGVLFSIFFMIRRREDDDEMVLEEDDWDDDDDWDEWDDDLE